MAIPQRKTEKRRGKTEARPATFSMRYILISVLTVLPSKGYSQTNSFVEFEIFSTQPKIAAGESFGVAGKIRSKSSNPILIKANSAKLIIPPEVCSSETVTEFNGKFLIESNDTQIIMHANEEIPVYWYDIRGSVLREAHSNKILWFFRPFLFEAGDYDFVATVQYKILDSDVEFQAISANHKFYIQAPARSLLFGGSLGALLGYVIVELRRRANLNKRKGLRSYITKTVGAILLGSIATILVSPLAQAEFIITLKITQFWRAIAFGFIVELMGFKFYERSLRSIFNSVQYLGESSKSLEK